MMTKGDKASIEAMEEHLRYFMKVYGDQDWDIELIKPLLGQYHDHLLRRLEAALRSRDHLMFDAPSTRTVRSNTTTNLDCAKGWEDDKWLPT